MRVVVVGATGNVGTSLLRSLADDPEVLLEGIRDGAGIDTPPLAAGTGGPLRIRELLTGVGSR